LSDDDALIRDIRSREGKYVDDDAVRPIATLYDRVGGEAFFDGLVGRFYDSVLADPVLRPLYHDDDLAGARQRLRDFLVQYWGGPTTYSDARGHPRLRMRHAPFVIAELERDRWLTHMRAAVDELAPGPAERDELLAYFEMAADAMRNATRPAP
jgi:hemoglobin